MMYISICQRVGRDLLGVAKPQEGVVISLKLYEISNGIKHLFHGLIVEVLFLFLTKVTD